jgi:hypothetical protein
MEAIRRIGLVTGAGFAALWLAASVSMAASSLAGSTPPEEIMANAYDRDNFGNSTRIDNRFFPQQPGRQLVFRGTTTEGKETIPHRVIFTVTDLTKEIDGVRSVVLWERDYSSGELVEAEIAFFAQDDDGNVWQLGEYPEEYEEGKIIASPLWIHGLQGAKAGLTMRAVPKTGTSSYSLGWGPAVGFNDRAKVTKTGIKTCVPRGCYGNVLLTSEFNPDEPGKYQLKYYAQGVGNVRVGWAGKNEDTKETLVLVKINRLGSKAMAQARAAARKLEAGAYARKKVYGETLPLEGD